VTARIRKAVFPVAGLGTRFVPATKASPKEMLPVVDKPLIQYAVEEAIAAGITILIFITGRNKRSIADHFDKAYELENELEKKNKQDILNIVRNIIPEGVTCIYIRQAEALGLGHAVLCARAAVGDEPFAVLLADDLIDGHERNCLDQMVDIYEKFRKSVIAVEVIPKEDSRKYGIISFEEVEPALGRIRSIVEKPEPDKAPSNMAVIGRYILTPGIFDQLKTTQKGAGGEIQLTDGIAALLQQEEIYSWQFKGKRYDCGSKFGYLQANIEYGLKDPEISRDLKNYINTLKQEKI
jgi:UTP--glucose-1-phosphate uridylyltransferase